MVFVPGRSVADRSTYGAHNCGVVAITRARVPRGRRRSEPGSTHARTLILANALCCDDVARPPHGSGFPFHGRNMAPTVTCQRTVTKSQFVHVEAASSHCKTQHFCGNDPRSRLV